MSEKVFLKEIYMGSDFGISLRSDFIDYLKNILNSNKFEAMSDYTLFLQGGKKAIEEIIQELESLWKK